jgi:hypothetical protein
VSQVNQLEQQREANKIAIERRDIAIKLYSNREFKKLIVDGFLRDDCAQYAQLSQDPALGEREQLDALRLSQAAGHLRRFLSVTIAMGNRAENQNAEIEQALDEVRLEEAAGDAEELAHAHQFDEGEDD